MKEVKIEEISAGNMIIVVTMSHSPHRMHLIFSIDKLLSK